MATRSVNIGYYKQRFNGRLGKFKRGVLIKLFGAVIKDTPVLTGRLRANWLFVSGLGGYPDAVETKDKGGQLTLGLVVAGVQSNVTEKDDTYSLVNSMDYAARIEYEGWSHTKAPEGMVRKNLIRIERILREQAR